MKKLSGMILASALSALACTDLTDLLSIVDDDGAMGSALADPVAPAGQCDAAKIRDQIVAHYGTSAAGTDRHGRRFADLGVVYDADDSGILEESELAAIDADFAAGCAAIQARLVAQYDTDGDGALSETELAEAQSAFNDAHGGGHHGRGHHGGGHRDGDRDGHHGPPPAATDASTAAPAPRPSPMLAEFDLNQDGTLDAAEKAALRPVVRARIAAGERPFVKPPAAPAAPAATDSTDSSSGSTDAGSGTDTSGTTDPVDPANP